jgi:Ran GTPase-activating protein (RanGAP) involved in mRNA processing and transport
MQVNKAIRFVNLAGNNIGPEGAKHLASALSSPGCALQAISLTGNPLEEEGTMAFGDMLRSNTSLRALDISNVRAGIKGLIKVGVTCSFKKMSGDALRALMMSNNTWVKWPARSTSERCASDLARGVRQEGREGRGEVRNSRRPYQGD